MGGEEPPAGARGRRCGHQPAEAGGGDEGEQTEGPRALKELPAPDEAVWSAPVAHSSIKAQMSAKFTVAGTDFFADFLRATPASQPVVAGFVLFPGVFPGQRASRAVAPSVMLA